MLFKKKPVEVEAVLYDGKNANEIINFSECKIKATDTDALLIETLEGAMTASVGDFIIRGVEGEFYPCKPDIFEKTYESAD